MENKVGFDSKLYLEIQSEKIIERAKQFNNKLYLEFGGKLFDDLHASRVLPGFDKDIKTQLLIQLKDKAEVIFCISAAEIEKNKIRTDLGLSYDGEVLKFVNNLRSLGISVNCIVVTLFKGQVGATKFARNLESYGEKVYFHSYTKGYPSNVDVIVSDEGYGENPFIETTKPIVVVAAPGHANGKLAFCLSQLYHEYKRGVKAGYAKFETFPVWNLPLKHPINIAYEAATADIKEINQIDPYHFNEYGTLAVNYNRDIDIFPVIKNILKKITGNKMYASPTDMGVNMLASAITDENIVEESAKKEIIRRYFKAECDYRRGLISFDTLERNRYLMSELDLNEDCLSIIPNTKAVAKASALPCVGLILQNGKMVYGKNKTVVSASAAVILNALRCLANLDDDFDIIPDNILMPIISLRRDYLNIKKQLLTLDDVLIALSISANSSEKAKKAVESIPLLNGCEAHSTFILPSAEVQTLTRLGINVTCQPVFLGSNISND